MTTTPTASPELPDLDHLEALARAADQGEGQHIYTNPRDSNGWQANEAWHRAASPAAVLALIALARRAQPYATGGTVPSGLHLVGEAPQAACTVPPDGWHCTRAPGHDGPCAAWPIAQQAAAPGAQLVIGVAAPQGATISIMQPHADGTTTVIYGGTHPAGDSMGRAVVAAAPANSPEIPDGSLTDEGTSAPGTPEAPSQLMQALTTGIPLQEPVYIAKALRAQREVRVSLAGGTGPGAAAFLVNIQMTPWTYTKETAEAYAWGYNRALKDYRAALLDVAAQLDGQGEGQ